MKSVSIWSFSAPYFPRFGLNNSEYGHLLRSDKSIKTEFQKKQPSPDIGSVWGTNFSNSKIFLEGELLSRMCF